MSTSARLFSLCFVLLLLTACGTSHHAASTLAGDDDDEGNASSGLPTTPPNNAVQVAFEARSYAPGATATLRLRGSAVVIKLRLYRAGAGPDGPLQGAPVSVERTFAHPASSLQIELGAWPGGFYYARVDTPGRGTWYAPFVLRPKRLGEHRVLVVLPTNTWQAYNFEDGNSWYLHASVQRIDLSRPYLNAGVPPHYHGYDRGFIRWLFLHGKQTDFVSDDDLDQVASGDQLARAYDLIIFSGHEEYVTQHEFDVTQRYRDLGGNLAFLSANDFFYKVVKHGDQMDGRWRWRDLGRPEAAVVGAQYVDWNHDVYPNKPFQVTGATQEPWLFRGTGLANGTAFGVYGIEVDAVAPSSPHGTHVLATIPNIFGAGKSAEMTYYQTPRGAKVFSAGVMNFGGSALWPQVREMIENLWAHLSVA
jgi:hypothetical protein